MTKPPPEPPKSRAIQRRDAQRAKDAQAFTEGRRVLPKGSRNTGKGTKDGKS